MAAVTRNMLLIVDNLFFLMLPASLSVVVAAFNSASPQGRMLAVKSLRYKTRVSRLLMEMERRSHVLFQQRSDHGGYSRVASRFGRSLLPHTIHQIQ